jgi:uncharacterized protein (DUF1501 family)
MEFKTLTGSKGPRALAAGGNFLFILTLQEFRPMSVMLDRRSLLAGGTGLALLGAKAFAAPAASGTRFLLVFLRGAYDAANVIAPTANPFYHEARPTLALAAPDPANPLAALPLDADWSLHPALKDSMAPLWQARQIAFVPFAGTDDMSRSHFETQDSIEMGQPITGSRHYGSGFMGRLAATLGANGKGTIAFSDTMPLVMRGGPMVPNLALGGNGRQVIDDGETAMIAAMYRGQRLGGVDLDGAVHAGFTARDTVWHTIDDEMRASARGAIPAKGFEAAAARIGVVMRDKYNLAFVDVGGWDTHVNQGGAQGQLAGRIGELGRGLAAYAAALGPEAWRQSVVVVISEFGRTFRENGNRGTDHGHGSVYWVMGGAVSGGRMVGPQVRITPDTLNQNRDLPVLTDYRALIGGLWQRQYGLSQAQLAGVFPDTAPAHLNLI